MWLRTRRKMTQQAAPEAVAKSGQRLTTQEYWEKYWNPVSTARMNPIESRPVRDGIARRTKLAIRAWCITRYFLRNYSDYVVWEKIYPKHLPSMAGANVLEVGCAPGDFLIRLQRTFGCVPYGVEYTSAGVELTRAAFLRNGLDPEKVIFADAFSHDFQSRFQSFFDGVVSRGVIEHFAEVKPIVGKHLALLKPGGWLALTIPNYRGCNYVLKRVFAPKSLAAHNLHIMRKQEFRNTCGIADLQESFCSYYGTCDLSMCVPEEG